MTDVESRLKECERRIVELQRRIAVLEQQNAINSTNALLLRAAPNQ